MNNFYMSGVSAKSNPQNTDEAVAVESAIRTATV